MREKLRSVTYPDTLHSLSKNYSLITMSAFHGAHSLERDHKLSNKQLIPTEVIKNSMFDNSCFWKE